jgi:hypothetical protein
MVNWSDHKIQELQKWAQCGHEFMELIAKSKLAAADDDLEKAGQIVEEILQKFADQRQARNYLEHIWAVSIIARRLDIAGQLVAERLAAGWRAEVRLAPRKTNRAGAARWFLSDDKAMAFEINEGAFDSDHTEFFVQGVIYYIALYAAYSHDANIQCGYVDVNIDDQPICPGLTGGGVGRDLFLIPDKIFVRFEGHQATARQCREDAVPWDERIPVAVWRGATGGIMEDPTIGWRSLPRVRLCQIARAPTALGLIDAGITQIVQVYDPVEADKLRQSGLVCPRMPADQIIRYKYQIDIDGNTNSWPGLFTKLLTGNPVLKVASPRGFRQWYYDRLKPWINFVPVASDLSDIVDKLVWLRAHDDAARRIGEQGLALAESLDYEGELKRAGRIITAAIRWSARLPEIALAFGVGADANACLRDGWAEPEDGGIPALGFESRVELPLPVGCDDYVLILDLSPCADAPAPLAQRVTVIANGEILHQTTLSARQVLCSSIPQRTWRAAETLRITLLHPDAVRAASAVRPLDTRFLSVTLHAIELVPGAVQAARGGDLGANR